MFIMANDSKDEITIDNFDLEIEDNDFLELTSITKEELNEDWFPIVGKKERLTQTHNYLNNSSTEDMSYITMYNASKIARKFLQRHLNVENEIWGTYTMKAIERKLSKHYWKNSTLAQP